VIQDKLQEDIILAFENKKTLTNDEIHNLLVNSFGHESLQLEELKLAMDYLTNVRKLFDFKEVGTNNPENNFTKKDSYYQIYKEVSQIRENRYSIQKLQKDNSVFYLVTFFIVIDIIIKICQFIKGQ
jgi:hypothetical protein